MDVKEAINRAREYLDWVFSDENISEIRLEEVSFDRDEKSWLITFGLLRPSIRAQQSPLSAALGPLPLKRSYKIVQIPDDQAQPPSIRIREFAEE